MNTSNTALTHMGGPRKPNLSWYDRQLPKSSKR